MMAVNGKNVHVMCVSGHFHCQSRYIIRGAASYMAAQPEIAGTVS